MTYLKDGFLLTLPLLCSTVLHMMIVKSNLFASLRIPLSKRLFGENKTWRAFVVLPVLTGVFFAIFLHFNMIPIYEKSTVLPFVVGYFLGLFYLIGELPNSFVKRRLGIVPGELPSKNRFIFFLLDRLDSSLSCALLYGLIWEVPLATLISFVLVGFCLHFVFTQFLWLLKIRQNRF